MNNLLVIAELFFTINNERAGFGVLRSDTYIRDNTLLPP
ncbi:Uncharacterised protein [Hafnia alvei]|uniref:Uncharacterized protein n=1 Tax=Hafnia alvei TaxID=569 RepID=A0A377TFM0_HAFAL|nr:Uncharacterised protein [Hafnia alvei]